MSPERALLRRVQESFDRNAASPCCVAYFMDEIDALLAEQEKPPRSRAEGSDLSVDQGREFRVVDGLGDNNRAGKVTIDPTLLSPPTPRSRAEAEAMVVRYDEANDALDSFDAIGTAAHLAALDEQYAARAALLAALTGEAT